MICAFSGEQLQRFIKYVTSKVVKQKLGDFESLAKSIYEEVPNKENALSYVQILPSIFGALSFANESVAQNTNSSSVSIAFDKSKEWNNNLEAVKRDLGLLEEDDSTPNKIFIDTNKDFSLRAFDRPYQASSYVDKGALNEAVNNESNPNEAVTLVIGKYSSNNLPRKTIPVLDKDGNIAPGGIELPVQADSFYVFLQYKGKNIGYIKPLQYYRNGEPISLDQLSKIVEMKDNDLAELKAQEPLWKNLFARLQQVAEPLEEGQTTSLSMGEAGINLVHNYNKFDLRVDAKPTLLGSDTTNQAYKNNGKGIIIRSALNGQTLTEADDPDAPLFPEYKDQDGNIKPFKGYYALATMPSGKKFWIGVRPSQLEQESNLEALGADVFAAAVSTAAIKEKTPENDLLAQSIADDLNSKYYFYTGSEYNIFFINSYDPDYVSEGVRGAYILKADILLKDSPSTENKVSAYFDRRSRAENTESVLKTLRTAANSRNIKITLDNRSVRRNIPFNRETKSFDPISQDQVGQLFQTTLGENIFANSFFTLQLTDAVAKEEKATIVSKKNQPKKKEVPTSDIQEQKADIERRRQEAIEGIQTMEELGLEAPIGKEGFFYADAFGVDPEESDLDSFEGKIKQEVIDKINAKYDAELAALEQKPKTPKGIAKAKITKAKEDFNDENAPFKLLLDGQDPITKEELDDLKKTLPGYISVEDLDTIASNLNVKGIPVGYFKDRVVYISGTKATQGTAYHEAFHAIFRTALSDKEIDTYLAEGRKQVPASRLTTEAKRSFVITRGYKDLTDQQIEDLIIEEHLADAYEKFRLSKKKPKGVLANLFQKLVNLFKWLTNRNTPLESLFNKIRSGGFVGATYKGNRFNNIGYGAFALIPGKPTLRESERIIKTVAALKVENPNVPIESILDDLADFYDPDSRENSAAVASGTADAQALADEWAIYSDEDVRAIITQEVEKQLSNYNYDSSKEDFLDLEEEYGRGTQDEFDKAIDETGGWESVSKEVRSFILFTTYPTIDPITGRTIRQIIDGEYVYANLERAIAGRGERGILSGIKALSNYNPQIKAVYDKLKAKTGLVESTADTIGNEEDFFSLDKDTYKSNLEGKMLLRRFLKAFEKTFVNHLQVLVDTELQSSRVFSSNRDDVGNIIFTRWQNNYLANVADKIQNSPAFRNSVVSGIGTFLQRYNSPTYGTQDLDRLKGILDSLGLEFSPIYLEFSFGVNDDSNVQSLRREFGELRRLDVAFLAKVRDYVSKRQNLFEVGDVTSEYSVDTSTGETHTVDIGLSSFILNFSHANAVFDSNIFQTNFQTADNKTRYSFVLPNFMISQTKETSKYYMDRNNIESAVQDPYLKYNHLVSYSSTNNVDYVRDNFKNMTIEFTGDIREESSEQYGQVIVSKKHLGNTFKDTDAKSLLLTVHSLFANSTVKSSIIDGRIIKREFARFWPFQIEAKSSMMSITMPVNRGLYNGGVSDVGRTRLSNYFRQEIQRISDSLDQGSIRFSVKNRKFAYFKFMNTPEVDQLLEIERDSRGNITKINPKLTTEKLTRIKELLVRGVESEIAEHKKRLSQYDIIQGDTNLLLPSNVIESYGSVDNYIGNFYMNDLLNTIGYSQIVMGDLSQFKDDIDFTKRMGGIFAAGVSRGARKYTAAYTTEATRYIYAESFSNNSPDTTPVTKNADESDSDFRKRLNEGLSNGSIIEINSDDAGSEMTAQEFIDIMFDLGRLDPLKLEALELLRDGIIPGSPQESRYKELVLKLGAKHGKNTTLGIDAVSLKLVTFGGQRNNIYYDKMSVAVLFKNFTSRWDAKEKRWVPQKGLEGLHNKRVWMEKNGIGQINPISAGKIKTDTPFDWTLFDNIVLDEDGPLPDGYYHSPITREGKDQRLQVEVESHGLDKVTAFSQAIQLIDTETTSASDKDRLEYYKTLEQMRKNSLDQALKLLTKEFVQDGVMTRDLEIFLKKLRNTIESSTPNYTLQEFLETEGKDTKYDFNLPSVQAKIEQVFISTFGNGVLKQKVRGRTFILRSSRNYNVIQDENGNVVPRDRYLRDPEKYESNTTRELRVHKLIDKDGKKYVQHAEVVISRGTAELFGLRIGDTIPEWLLEGFGVRIPTQSHHSMIPFKVVDFLPDYLGDTIIIPKEIVYLSGADFDIDKLFAYFRDFYMSKGKPKAYGSAKTPAERYGEYIRWQTANNSDLRILLREKRNNPEIKALKKKRDDLARRVFNGSVVDYVSEYVDNLAVPLDDQTRRRQDGTKTRTEEAQEDLLESFFNLYKEINPTLADRIDRKDALYKELEETERAYVNAVNSIEEEAFKELDLYTLEDFESNPSLTNNGALHNKIVDLYMKFSTSTQPTIVESLKTPASMDGLKADADLISRITGKSEGAFMVSGVNGKMDAWNNNTQGKKLVGIWANANGVGANLTKFKTRVNPEYAVFFDGTQYNTFAKEREDDIVIDLENNTVTIQKDTRRKADSISSGVSAATDNAKERLMARLNYTMNNTGVYAAMMLLGIGRLRTNLFAAQPVLLEVAELELAADTSIQPSRVNAFSQVYKDTLKTLQALSGIRDIKDFNRYLDTLGSNITSDDMLLRLQATPVTNEQKLAAAAHDYRVLMAFKKMQDVSKQMRLYGTLLSMNRGITSNFEYLQGLAENAYALDLGDLLGQDRLPSNKSQILPFNARANIVPRKENDLVDYTTLGNVESLRLILDVSSRYFLNQTAPAKQVNTELASSLIKDPDTEKIERSTSRLLNKRFYTFLITKAYRNWLSSKGIDSSTFNSLVYNNVGEETLAKKFRSLLGKSEFRSNELVRFMQTDLNKGTLDIVKINSRLKSTPKTEERFVDAYDALLKSKDKEIRQFGYDMFSYTMIKDGFNFANGSFVKFLKPTVFYQLAKVLKDLNKAVYTNQDTTGLLGSTMRETMNEFKEIYGRDVNNIASIRPLPTTSVDDQTVMQREVGPYKLDRTPDGFSITTPPIKTEKDLKRSTFIDYTVSSDGKVNFVWPDFFQFGGKPLKRTSGRIKTTSEGQVYTATYSLTTLFGNKDYNPYTNSLEYTEKLFNVASTSKETATKTLQSPEKSVSLSNKFNRTDKIITRDFVKANPRTLFLFGDNTTRKGLGGQAKEMRGESNAVGITTKKLPTRTVDAYLTDATYENNAAMIKSDIDIVIQKWNSGNYDNIVVPPLGVGLAELPTRAPRTYKFLQSELSRLENLISTPASTQSGTINIYSGTGENADLSNFAVRPFVIGGDEYQSVEQYFQYQKWNYLKDDITEDDFRKNQKIADSIMSTTSGSKLKSLGRQFVSLDTTRWDRNAAKEMKIAIKASFEQNPDALQRLLSTGTSILTHTQDKTKWGKEFPRLLMEVRSELSTPASTPLGGNTRVITRYPKTIIFNNNEYGSDKLLEIRSIFGEAVGDQEVSDQRIFTKSEHLIDYGMTSTQYKYALENEIVLDSLLRTSDKTTFVEIIDEILSINEILVDTAQMFLFSNEEISTPVPAVSDPLNEAFDRADQMAINEYAPEVVFTYLTNIPEGITEDQIDDLLEKIGLKNKEAVREHERQILDYSDYLEAVEAESKYNWVVYDGYGTESSTQELLELVRERAAEVFVGTSSLDFGDLRKLFNDYKDEKIEEEFVEAAKEKLQQYGLLRWVNYNPNQLSLFSQEEIDQVINQKDKGCNPG